MQPVMVLYREWLDCGEEYTADLTIPLIALFGSRRWNGLSVKLKRIYIRLQRLL
jgi:hypothetical protein